MTQKWLTLAQAVAYCGRSASTLKRRAQEGVDLGTIGALLGHTDKRATEIYTHVTDIRQREAIRKVMAGPVDLGD